MRIHWKLLVLATVVAAQPSVALARVCPFPSSGALALPLAGQRDVPTNTLLWTLFGRAGENRVLTKRSDGSRVNAISLLTVADASGSSWVAFTVFRPEKVLDPSETYEWSPDEGVDPQSFTTGAGPVESTPALPVVRDGPSTYDASCSGTIESLVVDSTAALTLLSGLYASPQLTIPAALASGGVSPDAVFEGVSFAYRPQLVRTFDLRAATYDLAGNFSGWTEPVTITPEPFVGPVLPMFCSHFPITAAWLPLLTVLALRRRNRLNRR